MTLRQLFRIHTLSFSIALLTISLAPASDQFTPQEQQQISLPTAGLFEKSNAFEVDFGQLRKDEYSFPLPVGKSEEVISGNLFISTSEGDAVKAMFEGVVRLSRRIEHWGNVVVVRHDNGLETVYGGNAQNLVKVGQRVKAGQTIAIVGKKEGQTGLEFAIMVNGARVNPATLIDVKSHSLRRQTVRFSKQGRGVSVSVTVSERNTRLASSARKDPFSLDPDDEIKVEEGKELKIDLTKLAKEHWAYPLPGSHVISPYGGKRNHAGVDVKTKPNDNILAAFDGVVTLSGPHYGYGNCITIKHAYGFETLYSHQSKNFVKVGQKVKAGQVIGLTGRTGRATTEHLHFEVHFKGRRINPATIFDHANKKLQATTINIKNGRMTTRKN